MLTKIISSHGILRLIAPRLPCIGERIEIEEYGLATVEKVYSSLGDNWIEFLLEKTLIGRHRALYRFEIET